MIRMADRWVLRRSSALVMAVSISLTAALSAAEARHSGYRSHSSHHSVAHSAPSARSTPASMAAVKRLIAMKEESSAAPEGKVEKKQEQEEKKSEAKPTTEMAETVKPSLFKKVISVTGLAGGKTEDKAAGEEKGKKRNMDADAGSKAADKSDSKTASKSDSKAADKSDSKTASKSDLKAASKFDSKTASKSDSKTASKADLKANNATAVPAKSKPVPAVVVNTLPAASSTANNSTDAQAPKYEMDTALLSVLKDITKALKESEDVGKLEDPAQKLAVTTATEALEKALAGAEINPNRIVGSDIKDRLEKGLSAESWDSGELDLSGDARASLSVLWAKKVNGLVNVSIAGNCGGKTGPSGERAGEFIVVINGKSTLDSGFDIQSQSTVNFWLGKLTSFTVDAGNASASNKDTVVPLKAVVTPRRKIFLEKLEKWQVAKAEAAEAAKLTKIAEEESAAKKSGNVSDAAEQAGAGVNETVAEKSSESAAVAAAAVHETKSTDKPKPDKQATIDSPPGPEPAKTKIAAAETGVASQSETTKPQAANAEAAKSELAASTESSVAAPSVVVKTLPPPAVATSVVSTERPIVPPAVVMPTTPQAPQVVPSQTTAIQAIRSPRNQASPLIQSHPNARWRANS